MQTEFISYMDGDVECEGYVAMLPGLAKPTPIVLVCHAWGGQDAFACRKAEELAGLGYIGFAIDVYGKGRRGRTPEENGELMKPFVENRAKLRQRLLAAVNVAHRITPADPHRIAAIGFCFGGLCALDLARAAAPGVRAVVSFHGLFGPPNIAPQAKIGASVLALHGYDDPMCTPDAVQGLAKELTDAGAEWEIDMYGHTVHAFTNPEANNPAFGTVFKQRVSDRAFERMRDFLRETLGA
jgi:dienelactone hydrolase